MTERQKEITIMTIIKPEKIRKLNTELFKAYLYFVLTIFDFDMETINSIFKMIELLSNSILDEEVIKNYQNYLKRKEN